MYRYRRSTTITAITHDGDKRKHIPAVEQDAAIVVEPDAQSTGEPPSFAPDAYSFAPAFWNILIK
jgi:hypothetical protein